MSILDIQPLQPEHEALVRLGGLCFGCFQPIAKEVRHYYLVEHIASGEKPHKSFHGMINYPYDQYTIMYRIDPFRAVSIVKVVVFKDITMVDPCYGFAEQSFFGKADIALGNLMTGGGLSPSSVEAFLKDLIQ